MVAQVEGLVYVPLWLDAALQASLLEWVDAQPWDTSLARRVQHYGARYEYGGRKLAPQRLGPLPSPLATLSERLLDEGRFAQRPDQVIVNEYEPGQGIAAHVDCLSCFGPQIASVSLGSSCEMAFKHETHAVALDLAPGSLLVMDGPARTHYKHGIAKRRTDLIEGQRRARARRVSLTFRVVSHQ